MATKERPSDAKRQMLDAIECAVVKRPLFSVLCKLTSSYDQADRAIDDRRIRMHLAEPLRRYVSRLSEETARQIVTTVRDNPGAIHALHAELGPVELLATAIVFLWKRIVRVDAYLAASTVSPAEPNGADD
jgi:hypothetical protein